jgi:serine/threonine protein kinase
MTDYTLAGLEEAFPRFANYAMLGRGGEGAALSVWDRVRKMDLALKLMRDNGDPGLSERFDHEYELLASSRSSRLVTVYDHGQTPIRLSDGSMPNHYWYTMEKCESSLRKELRGLNLGVRVNVALQLIDGLAFVHAKGIAHRDIKPDNIFLVKGAQVKIGDFGLAIVSALGQRGSGSNPGGMVMGSPPYLAPERWTGSQGEDWRPSDQYAAGVVLFELLSLGSAALPFGRDIASYYQAHITARPYALVIPEHRMRSFPSVDYVIQTMLAKRPEDRYPDMAQCKRELTAALAQDAVI